MDICPFTETIYTDTFLLLLKIVYYQAGGMSSVFCLWGLCFCRWRGFLSPAQTVSCRLSVRRETASLSEQLVWFLRAGSEQGPAAGRIAPIPLFHVRRRVKWFNHAVPDAVRRVREKYTTRNGRDSI